jgi:hypothetical protein
MAVMNMKKCQILLSMCVLITNSMAEVSSKKPYRDLATYLQKSIIEHSVPDIESALQSLAKSQSTLKSFDGMSHELYQRSHGNSMKGSSGRVERTAGK